MIRRAYIVGPATALFITDLWDRATQHAHWDSLFIMQLSRWYSCRRVERATQRLLTRGASGRLDLLRRVLEEKLDLLGERGEAELDGQLVFPFDRPRRIEDYEQSGN